MSASDVLTVLYLNIFIFTFSYVQIPPVNLAVNINFNWPTEPDLCSVPYSNIMNDVCSHKVLDAYVMS
jgi:hypothetical protein